MKGYGEMRYLTFALAKGRLAKKTLALLEQIGITCEEMKDPDTRKLIFVNEELKMKFFLSKATDVLKLIFIIRRRIIILFFVKLNRCFIYVRGFHMPVIKHDVPHLFYCNS